MDTAVYKNVPFLQYKIEDEKMEDEKNSLSGVLPSDKAEKYGNKRNFFILVHYIVFKYKQMLNNFESIFFYTKFFALFFCPIVGLKTNHHLYPF